MRLELFISHIASLIETDGVFELSIQGMNGLYSWRITKRTLSGSREIAERGGYKRIQDAKRIGRQRLRQYSGRH